MPAATATSTPEAAVHTAAKRFDDEFVKAWNSHKVEKLLSLMTDDVIYDDASWATEMHGHAEVRAFLESTWRAVPDLSFKHEDTVLVDASGTRSARYWTGKGTHTGPWNPPGLRPTGRSFKFHGASFLESRDGKLSRIRVVYDVTDVMRQLGVLPGHASIGERLIMLAANLRRLLPG